MYSDDVAIRVTSLNKCYQIYDEPRDRLKQFIMPRLQKVLGQSPKQYFREFWALKETSFEIKKGETVGIIGRNGSGKSTLLQLICGTLNPTNGIIQTHGRIAALLELGSGFNPEYSGRENVYMNAAVLGLSNDEIDKKFNDIATFADIGDFIEQPVKTYSSGMVVRLAFAVIAHVDADILIIDEALSVGDAFFVQKCMRFLRKFMEKGTVLFVSHDTGAVLNLCQRAILLQEGIIIAQGEPKEVTEHYLEKLYESQQGEGDVQKNINISHLSSKVRPVRDMRLDFINQTKFRNDIELFSFDPNSPSFGIGGAQIVNVQMLDKHGNNLVWLVGGEEVKLQINCRTDTDLLSPICGFQIKDRLGQFLFGDNTYITYASSPKKIPPATFFTATFGFIMPILPVGDYTITAALANGTQDDHVQHHWVHDAIAFKVHNSSVCQGLIGIQMHQISIDFEK